VKKKKPAKHQNGYGEQGTRGKGHVSPLKGDWRSHGGTSVCVFDWGLAGGLKRQACKVVHWDRECRDIQAQITDR
jgi:hypothetical protein